MSRKRGARQGISGSIFAGSALKWHILFGLIIVFGLLVLNFEYYASANSISKIGFYYPRGLSLQQTPGQNTSHTFASYELDQVSVGPINDIVCFSDHDERKLAFRRFNAVDIDEKSRRLFFVGPNYRYKTYFDHGVAVQLILMPINGAQGNLLCIIGDEKNAISRALNRLVFISTLDFRYQ